MNNALSVRMHVLIRRISADDGTDVCEFNEGYPTPNGIDTTDLVCLKTQPASLSSKLMLKCCALYSDGVNAVSGSSVMAH